MDVYQDNWNACLLYRNKQLTRQLKDYQRIMSLVECSVSLMVAMGQLICLHQRPTYGIVRDEIEWQHLFTVIDLLYGSSLSENLALFSLSAQEMKVCYLIRCRLSNADVATLFNITSRSVVKTKQRIKNKLSLSAKDSLDEYIQQQF